MQSIWLSLLWKEWCEHRWKLAALSSSMLVVMLLVFFKFRTSVPDVVTFVTASLMTYALLATFFVAMSVAGGESSRKTMPFLQSLPVPMWQPAAAKLFVAGVTLVVPIILTMTVVYSTLQLVEFSTREVQNSINWNLRTGPRVWRIHDWYVARTVGPVLGSLSLLLWLAAAGVNRSDEIRAGAVGFLSITAIWISFAYLFHVADKQDLPNLEAGLLVAMPAGPGVPGVFPLRGDTPLRYFVSWGIVYAPYLLTALVGHAAVGAWYLGRFGRVKHKPKRGGIGQSLVMPGYALGQPMRSQLTAIAWKQMRETGPLAAFALAAILGITAIVLMADETGRVDFSEIFTQVGACMSFFVFLVAGIGLYLDDIKPELNSFWRSRPTNLPLWFGIKYATAFLVLLTVLGIPLILGTLIYSNQLPGRFSEGMLANLLWIGWFFIEAFTLAMTLQCLLRQPLYAAILTCVTLMFGNFAYSYVCYETIGHPPWSLNAAVMILALVATVALAWQTVKHDWGWKH